MKLLIVASLVFGASVSWSESDRHAKPAHAEPYYVAPSGHATDSGYAEGNMVAPSQISSGTEQSRGIAGKPWHHPRKHPRKPVQHPASVRE